jgi:hypothetical protein
MKAAATAIFLIAILSGFALWKLQTPAAPAHEKPPAAPAATPVNEVDKTTQRSFWPPGAGAAGWSGSVTRFDGENFALLTLRGNPQERGTAHGKLMGKEVQAVVNGVKRYLSAGDQYAQCIDGTRVMRRYIDADVLEELDSCAAAVGITSDDLLLAQLFGDVARGKKIRTFCSAFAAFGPATEQGTLVVGRNFDYAGFGLEEGMPVIMQIIPTGTSAGRPFITIGYAGILNGWTAMNADGLCVSNNTLFSGTDTLEGMSTCFLLRKIAERATTVEDGVKIIEDTARACTTGMLVAGKNSQGNWDARFVEFDSKNIAIVEPVGGVVLSTNSRQKLPSAAGVGAGEVTCTRFNALKRRLAILAGTLTFNSAKHDVIAASDVYMSINLHCATLDPGSQRVRLAVKTRPDGKPAAQEAFRNYKVHADRIERLE